MKEAGPHENTSLHRLHLEVQGKVQGVGFRPFVYRLATQSKLNGWIENTPQGTLIEVQGPLVDVEIFQRRLRLQTPPSAKIETIKTSTLSPQQENGFTIRPSQKAGPRLSVVSPDLATCQECLDEINDPSSRRYRYPFTTCTQCGPRYSIVEEIPFDRVNTTMKRFSLCEACQCEYEDLANRRFHAEAIACPTCGPHLELWNDEGTVLANTEKALLQACTMVREGKILAVKGLGGFQFLCDAQNDKTIQELRHRKHRLRKPFAVLFPSMEALTKHCECSEEERTILTSPESPIVILRRKKKSTLASVAAPGNPYIGAMLPYTPLHHLLMAELLIPAIATSGNRSEEPIVIDEQEARSRLSQIADAYLLHDRPISRPIDDSVVRVVNGEPMVLRRARGYAPTPITARAQRSNGKTLSRVLAVGAHLKNTVAVTIQDKVVMSQHIGDLSTPEACTQLEQTVSEHLKLFDVEPQGIACDLHPDYRSTIFAKKLGEEMNIPVIQVQHHFAHILSCMTEHGLEGPVLGVAWDGAGYGSDGTIWGGEFLLADYSGFTRVGHLRTFRLPGGEICMREPRRVALSLLYETFGDECLNMNLPPIQSLGPELAQSLVELLEKNVNCTPTTSMGRIFDGISSLLGLCHLNTFDGEAAMALEFAAEDSARKGGDTRLPISFVLNRQVEKCTSEAKEFIADWQPLVESAVRETFKGKTPGAIGLNFHRALSKLTVEGAKILKNSRIVLSGGVFQNSLILKFAQDELRKENFQVYSHHHIPPNDGGLALGQALAASSDLIKKRF
ncbi:carbamoyltransferase HypF [Candidatus Nitronereus thalassa]|uniref:Carbamoyltransferase n=1 Tax=Candidatus Nitronereus thalassa TaxID=3020898 RepID=A0ABU3K8V1_9BACT|nr:carbamoyltransferase HypF [Candidatus Nitronereus thalassa]MDT7042837.1 carbamoyltransferase HypF [Candidatus Nitronereus thalassa]